MHSLRDTLRRKDTKNFNAKDAKGARDAKKEKKVTSNIERQTSNFELPWRGAGTTDEFFRDPD